MLMKDRKLPSVIFPSVVNSTSQFRDVAEHFEPEAGLVRFFLDGSGL